MTLLYSTTISAVRCQTCSSARRSQLGDRYASMLPGPIRGIRGRIMFSCGGPGARLDSNAMEQDCGGDETDVNVLEW
jgi:hypothetical protein